MIEAGYLSYETAQWVRSEKHLLEIKRVSEEMFCEACGYVFSSNRVDSKERHIKNGAWYVSSREEYRC
ncbi:hypothetical protein JB92DRAFT_2959167 [Gautieria morchelliformis]|nr:hypothetical protein JB92DRAFT_2959167 [Gautieria morchelliformis]